MVVLSTRNFTWILISDILVFVHSFRYWTKELLFRGGFSKVGGVVTTRWILPGGVVISRQILRVWRIIEAPTCWWRITEAPAYWWRIIEAPTCWLEDYRGSCLLVGGSSWLLLVWLVLQVVLLAAEARFN